MISPTENRLALSPAEAAKVAGISRSEVYNELAAGKITGRKFGRRTLIEMASLRAWLDALPAYQSKAAA